MALPLLPLLLLGGAAALTVAAASKKKRTRNTSARLPSVLDDFWPHQGSFKGSGGRRVVLRDGSIVGPMTAAEMQAIDPHHPNPVEGFIGPESTDDVIIIDIPQVSNSRFGGSVPGGHKKPPLRQNPCTNAVRLLGQSMHLKELAESLYVEGMDPDSQQARRMDDLAGKAADKLKAFFEWQDRMVPENYTDFYDLALKIMPDAEAVTWTEVFLQEDSNKLSSIQDSILTFTSGQDGTVTPKQVIFRFLVHIRDLHSNFTPNLYMPFPSSNSIGKGPVSVPWPQPVTDAMRYPRLRVDAGTQQCSTEGYTFDETGVVSIDSEGDGGPYVKIPVWMLSYHKIIPNEEPETLERWARKLHHIENADWGNPSEVVFIPQPARAHAGYFFPEENRPRARRLTYLVGQDRWLIGFPPSEALPDGENLEVEAPPPGAAIARPDLF